MHSYFLSQVAWCEERQVEEPRIVWASRSQCRQRQGRTGRTGRGVVYRLIPRNSYMKLNPFEQPAMQLRPLRREALALMSGAEKTLRDVQVIDRSLPSLHLFISPTMSDSAG